MFCIVVLVVVFLLLPSVGVVGDVVVAVVVVMLAALVGVVVGGGGVVGQTNRQTKTNRRTEGRTDRQTWILRHEGCTPPRRAIRSRRTLRLVLFVPRKPRACSTLRPPTM